MHEPTRAFLVTDTITAPSAPELQTVTHAFAHACRRVTVSGTPVVLLATAYLSTQQRWLGLFLANSHEDVHHVAAIAQLASFTVTEV